MAAERILVIDDEPGVRTTLTAILEDEGFLVETAVSGEEGVKKAMTGRVDSVLLDVWLPGIDGIEALGRLRESRVDTQVIMISGHANIETAVRATKLGAFDFVEKPLSLEKTLLVLRNALRQRMLEDRARRLMRLISRDTEISGSSSASDLLRDRINEAAGSEGAVLVIGERGSGREAVARRIYALGRRSEEAFVDIHCGALDSGTAGELIFGTGETPGRTSMARSGTILLEDVDLMPAELQERLESWLRSSQFEDLDTRALATAGAGEDRLLPALKEQVGVLIIEVPALRNRREDIVDLANHYMSLLGREYGNPGKSFSDDCLKVLVAWNWPGNVRELRNLMENLLLHVHETVVQVSDLPETMGGAKIAPVDLYGRFETLAAGVEAYEHYYVRRILKEENGETGKAAARLAISESELNARLKAG
jgi:two-component system nitrogen regulation response regulator NtrX